MLNQRRWQSLGGQHGKGADWVFGKMSFQTAFEGVKSGWKSDIKRKSIPDCWSQVTKRSFTKFYQPPANQLHSIISYVTSCILWISILRCILVLRYIRWFIVNCFNCWLFCWSSVTFIVAGCRYSKLVLFYAYNNFLVIFIYLMKLKS